MSHVLQILRGVRAAATDPAEIAELDAAIAKLEAPEPVGDVAAALAALSAKVDALAAKIDGNTTPAAMGPKYVDGLRDPDPETGFAFSQLLDQALAKNPALGIGPRVCVRTVATAFPALRIPVVNGCSLVDYNCDNAGFRNHITTNFYGHIVDGVVALYGKTRADWEQEIRVLIVARAQDAAPGNTGDQFTPH